MNNTTGQSPGGQGNCAAMYTDSKEIKITKTILCSIIMLAALIGNIFVIYVVYVKRNMRKTANIFIANMAVSDTFIGAVVIPRILAELFLGPHLWLVGGPFGSLLCKFCFFFADFSVCISITSHAVIALDRFCAIVYSLRPSPITSANRKYIIALIWLYALVLHCPNLYSWQVLQKGDKNFCIVDWRPLSPYSPLILFTFILIFVICIPLAMIIVLYFWLVVSVTRNSMFKTHTKQIRKQRRKEDVAVLRNVVVMVMVFLISLLPITIIGVLYHYHWKTLPCGAWDFMFAAHVLLLSNCAINPWLCISLHASYRKHLKKTFLARKATFTSGRENSMTTKVFEDGEATMGENLL